jgi:hypothetical protein
MEWLNLMVSLSNHQQHVFSAAVMTSPNGLSPKLALELLREADEKAAARAELRGEPANPQAVAQFVDVSRSPFQLSVSEFPNSGLSAFSEGAPGWRSTVRSSASSASGNGTHATAVSLLSASRSAIGH